MVTVAGDRIPFWLWPNVLSLDAPVVAVLWQALLAQAFHVRIGWREPCAFFCAVWTIYIADRLFDVRCPAPAGWEPERKRFYRRHRSAMTGIGVAAASSAMVVAVLSPFIHSLLVATVILSACVATYFTVLHAGHSDNLPTWPRELAVAVIFSIGTFFPIAFSTRSFAHVAACGALFASLCWVNTATIESEEWGRNRRTREPGLLACFIQRHEKSILLLIALLSLVVYCLGWVPRLFFGAMFAACLVLLAVAFRRSRVSASFFRAAMDGALCSPAVLLLLHHLP